MRVLDMVRRKLTAISLSSLLVISMASLGFRESGRKQGYGSPYGDS